MASKVTDKDKGLKDLSKRVAQSKELVLTVGIHGEEGDQAHSGDNGSSLTVGDVMTIHEYGLGDNPERSWLRAWADEHESENKDALRRIGAAVVKGRFSASQGLERAGNLFVGQIQARISSNIPPPLSAVTIKRKGSSVSLIDTGQGRSSIRYQVKKQ